MSASRCCADGRCAGCVVLRRQVRAGLRRAAACEGFRRSLRTLFSGAESLEIEALLLELEAESRLYRETIAALGGA